MEAILADEGRTESRLAESAYRKVVLRILPFLMLCFIFNYLDKVNVGFAKLSMLRDLGFSEAAFGFGAGVLFLGLVVFEVPSNFIMLKFGARVTISRIMILWGVMSLLTAFVATETQFYLIRFLIGVAEGGFWPGMVLYLSFWFPAKHRARTAALLTTAIPIAGMLGGPLSGYILSRMHGLFGLAGWKWLFLMEGAPAVLLGLLVPMVLSNSPRQARWLNDNERALILANLGEEEKIKAAVAHSKGDFLGALKDKRTWILVALAACSSATFYSISVWLPSLVRELGYSDPVTVGWLSAIPYAFTAISINVMGYTSDRFKERRWHTSMAFAATAVLVVGTVVFDKHPMFAMVLLTLATGMAYSATFLMWSLPALILSGAGLAGAAAVINSLGALGGFVTPYVIGVAVSMTHSAGAGLIFVAAICVVGAALVFVLPRAAINR